MDVAFILKKYPKSSETFIINQARALIKRGHQVDIYAQERPSDQVSDTEPPVNNVTYLESISVRDKVTSVLDTQFLSLFHHPEFPIRVLKHGTGAVPQTDLWRRRSDPILKNTDKYDAIHAHYGPVGNAFQFLESEADAPFITSFYGYDASELLEKNPWRYEILFDSATAIGSLSSDMDEELVENGCPAKKITRFPLPVDTTAFQFSPPSTDPNGPAQLLSACRLVEKKGLRYVLRALKSLDDEHEIRYRIAGDGPLRSDLESQVRESGLSDMVEFLGWKNSEEVAQLMADSDIFVQTSTTSSTGDKEGTPTVLLEAQARGLPVISTWHAGIPEIIDNCSSGLLVPERDSKAIEAALDHLLSEPSKRKELGRNGYELVKNQHSFAAVADVLEHMYQN